MSLVSIYLHLIRSALIETCSVLRDVAQPIVLLSVVCLFTAVNLCAVRTHAPR